MKNLTLSTLVLSSCLFMSCSGGGTSDTPRNPVTSAAPDPVTSPTPSDPTPTPVTQKTLDADGPDNGLTAYDLIREFGGPAPIESPDLYDVNHPGVAHIYEEHDEEVGNHFVFTLHRDTDIDRDRIELTDRQRNEIKAYSGSERALKGYENDIFEYSWKFKVNDSMEVSRNFTHLFQLKAVGSGSSTPLLTISGADRGEGDLIEVRHSPIQETSVISSNSWALALGEWVKVVCRVTYANDGKLSLTATRLGDDTLILSVEQENIDMWRGENEEDFVRPKWGILRSLADRDNLRADEEIVRFANFSVTRLVAIEDDD